MRTIEEVDVPLESTLSPYSDPFTSPSSPLPTSGKKLYLDTDSQLHQFLAANPHFAYSALLKEHIADVPKGIWISSDWSTNYESIVAYATMQNAVPIFIVYNAIQRDLGGESAGGALTLADYFHWIESFVRKTKRIEMIVILEPDALPHLPEMRVAEQALRVRMIAGALERLRQHKKASVYMDIGHPHWLSVDTAARMLQQFKSTQFDGFALNVANRQPTQDCLAYGVAVSQKVGGKHFVIDTSRNAIPHEDWCNPSPEGCGEKPTFTTGHALCDAYLWLKSPGESDGTCNSGPPAGVLWLERAVQVASNAK